MKMIYRFDGFTPPPLSEADLQKELNRRKVARQSALAALGGILLHILSFLLALGIYPLSPNLSLIALIFCLASAMGGGAVAIAFLKNRRFCIQ